MDYRKLTFYNTLGNLVYLFAQWLFTVLVVRISGIESAGIMSLAISAGNIFFFIQCYGMRSFQVSDVKGEYSAKRYVLSRYSTIIIGLVLCILYCLICGYSIDKAGAILAFLLYRTFEAMSDVYFSELQKIGRLEILAKSMSLKGILSVGVFSIVLYFTDNLTLALIAISVLAMLITVIYDRRKFCELITSEKIGFKLNDSFKLLKVCFVLMVSVLLPVIITSIPRIMLEQYHGTELLGHYGNVSAPPTLIIAVIPSILTPLMTLYGNWIKEKETKKLIFAFLMSLVGTVIFGLVCMLGVFLLGEPVMALIFTDEIIPYVHYLYPLIVVLTIYSMTFCANSLLICLRYKNDVFIYSIIASLLCVVISPYLIKNYDIWGVIFSMGISYFAELVGLCISVAFRYKKYAKSV